MGHPAKVLAVKTARGFESLPLRQKTKSGSEAKIISKTGKILVVSELAKEYGFKDVDGTQPMPYDTL